MTKSTLLAVPALVAAFLAVASNLTATPRGLAQRVSQASPCAPLNLDISTGTAGTTGGSNGDPNWTVSSTLPDVSTPTAYGVIPDPAWATPSPSANWIRPSNTTDNNTTDGSDLEPGGGGYNYTYTLAFPLNLSVYQNPTLTVSYTSDNESILKLNGSQFGTAGPSDSASLQGPFTVTAGFLPGVNTLEADVRNRLSSGGDPTQTGLLVIGTVTADCIPVTPTPAPAGPSCQPFAWNISTGLAGIGAADAQWTVTSAPSGVTTGNAYGVPPYASAWVSPPPPPPPPPLSFPPENWIEPGPSASPISSPVGAPGGTYVYDLPFTLSGTYQNPQLTFSFAADNSVAFFLDGNSLASLGGIDLSTTAFQALHGPVTVTGSTSPALAVGSHTLEAQVTNLPDGFPTGLLVSGVLTACISTAASTATAIATATATRTVTPTATATRPPTGCDLAITKTGSPKPGPERSTGDVHPHRDECGNRAMPWPRWGSGHDNDGTGHLACRPEHDPDCPDNG